MKHEATNKPKPILCYGKLGPHGEVSKMVVMHHGRIVIGNTPAGIPYMYSLN